MKRWDQYEIKAEVYRRGSTLQKIALAAGLNLWSTSVAMHRRHFAAEKAIGAFLGIPLHELWPTRYAAPTPKPSSANLAGARPRAPVESAG